MCFSFSLKCINITMIHFRKFVMKVWNIANGLPIKQKCKIDFWKFNHFGNTCHTFWCKSKKWILTIFKISLGYEVMKSLHRTFHHIPPHIIALQWTSEMDTRTVSLCVCMCIWVKQTSSIMTTRWALNIKSCFKIFIIPWPRKSVVIILKELWRQCNLGLANRVDANFLLQQ